MEKQIINTKNAPTAIGPYSQAVRVGNLLFTSGQMPVDPNTGVMVVDDIKKATERCLENIKAILEEADTSLEKVIKTTVYIKDMNDFAAMNEVYGKYFLANQPARSCVEVARLPKDCRVEIEVIALLN